MVEIRKKKKYNRNIFLITLFWGLSNIENKTWCLIKWNTQSHRTYITLCVHVINACQCYALLNYFFFFSFRLRYNMLATFRYIVGIGPKNKTNNKLSSGHLSVGPGPISKPRKLSCPPQFSMVAPLQKYLWPVEKRRRLDTAKKSGRVTRPDSFTVFNMEYDVT